MTTSAKQMRLRECDVWDADTRSAVAELRLSQKNDHSFETCYWWFAHENFDFDAALSQLNAPSSSYAILPTLFNSPSKLATSGTGVFPTEIWQLICRHLAQAELMNIRRTNKALADVAAEGLIGDVRVDTSFDSLRRLSSIANHDLLRKGVKTIRYEAGLLHDVGCLHNYQNHFDLPHHGKPKPPNKSTPRADRLYKRNLEKFNKEVLDKYSTYRRLFELQKLIINGPKDSLFPDLKTFPNLHTIVFQTGALCPHNFSSHFNNKYSRDCAVPLSVDSSPTVWQLEQLLVTGLKHLIMTQISPEFFNGRHGRNVDWLKSVFASLEELFVSFKESSHQAADTVITNTPASKSILRGTCFTDALAAATNLRTLTVNFFPGYPLPSSTIADALGKSILTNLRLLDLDCVKTTETELVYNLKAFPKLYSLSLANIVITAGDWVSAASRIRNELNLEEAILLGWLEDPGDEYVCSWADRELWIEGDELTLTMALDMYLTDHTDDTEDFDLFVNPFLRYDDDFDDPEILLEQFGPTGDEFLSHSDMAESDEDDESTDSSDHEGVPSLDDSDQLPMDVD